MDRIEEKRADVLRDLALQLVDACRVDIEASPDAAGRDGDERSAAAVSLALQTVFMAETMTQRHSEGVVALDQTRAFGMFVGLGQGVGHILGANGDAASLDFAMRAYMVGFAATLPERMKHSGAAFRRSTFGKRGQP